MERGGVVLGALATESPASNKERLADSYLGFSVGWSLLVTDARANDAAEACMMRCRLGKFTAHS
jgi:hypothetical protein